MLIGVVLVTLAGPAHAQRPWTATLALGYGITTAGGPGSYSVLLEGFRRVGSTTDLGLAFGVHRFGTNTNTSTDIYGPGTMQTEAFGRDLMQVGAALRWRPQDPQGAYIYWTFGAGLYVFRTTDLITATEADGTPIPQAFFEQIRTHESLGISAEVGKARLAVIGPVGVGVMARWHVFGFPTGMAHMFAVAISLDVPR
jgi:hypothetical protein